MSSSTRSPSINEARGFSITPYAGEWEYALKPATLGWGVAEDYEPSVIDFNPEFRIEMDFPWLKRFALDEGKESSIADLEMLIDQVTQMNLEGNFDGIDSIFRMASTRRYNFDFSTSILRTTYQYRSKLPSWTNWLIQTAALLASEGENVEEELDGLV